MNSLENALNQKNDDIKSQLEQIDQKIEALERKEMEIISNIESSVQTKMEAFENKIETLIKCLAEKDVYIATFEEIFRKLEDKLANIETNQTKALLEINIEEVKEPEQIFNCTKCNFETSSEKALQIHNIQKHTKYEKENYPRSCDVC